jgi:hypothetical protein
MLDQDVIFNLKFQRTSPQSRICIIFTILLKFLKMKFRLIFNLNLSE